MWHSVRQITETRFFASVPDLQLEPLYIFNPLQAMTARHISVIVMLLGAAAAQLVPTTEFRKTFKLERPIIPLLEPTFCFCQGKAIGGRQMAGYAQQRSLSTIKLSL